MGRNTEKKPRTNLQNLYKKLSKEIKSYRKVGRPITKRGAIEKIPILLLEKLPFLKGNKNYFAF